MSVAPALMVVPLKIVREYFAWFVAFFPPGATVTTATVGERADAVEAVVAVVAVDAVVAVVAAAAVTDVALLNADIQYYII